MIALFVVLRAYSQLIFLSLCLSAVICLILLILGRIKKRKIGIPKKKNLIIAMIVALMIVGVAGYCLYRNLQQPVTPLQGGEPVAEDKIADWKTHRNEEYGFEVKCPKDWKIEEAVIADSEESKPISISSFCPKDKVYYHTLGGYTKGVINPISIGIWRNMEDYQKMYGGGVAKAKEVLISDNLSSLYWGNELGEIFYVFENPNNNIIATIRSVIDMILTDPSEVSEAEELKKVFNQMLSSFKFIEI